MTTPYKQVFLYENYFTGSKQVLIRGVLPVFRNPNTRTRKPTDNQHKATGQAETECRTKQCARQPTTPYQRLINIYTLTPPAFPSIPTYQPSIPPSPTNQPANHPFLPTSLPTLAGKPSRPPQHSEPQSPLMPPHGPAHHQPVPSTPPPQRSAAGPLHPPTPAPPLARDRPAGNHEAGR